MSSPPAGQRRYQINITQTARLELRQLPVEAEPLVWATIDSLEIEPHPPQAEELPTLPGRYRIVVVTPPRLNWHILYSVENPRNRIVTIYRVRIET
jgi:hypothetical protein